jgi:hypothetical protein
MQPRAWLFLVSRVTTGRRYNTPLASEGMVGNSAKVNSDGSKETQQNSAVSLWGIGAESASYASSESSRVRYYSKSSINVNEYMNLEDDELLRRVVTPDI